MLLREWIKSAVALAGYEIRRPGSTGRTMKTALKHLVDVRVDPRTVIDVGVASGTPELYAAFPRATYLLVEALNEFEPSIKSLLAGRITGSYFIGAAAEREGTTEILPRGETSSVFREVDRSDARAERREIATVRLDKLCRDRELGGPYFIKVDVQGAELNVLAGATAILDATEVIVLEVSLLPLLEGVPEFTEVVEWLAARDFVTYDIFDGLARPYDGAMAQLDMAFVKRGGRLREYRGFRDRYPVG